jgi:hypothetical protein
MLFLVKEDEQSRPIYVSKFSTGTVVLDTNLFSELIEQFGHGVVLLSLNIIGACLQRVDKSAYAGHRGLAALGPFDALGDSYQEQ